MLELWTRTVIDSDRNVRCSNVPWVLEGLRLDSTGFGTLGTDYRSGSRPHQVNPIGLTSVVRQESLLVFLFTGSTNLRALRETIKFLSIFGDVSRIIDDARGRCPFSE